MSELKDEIVKLIKEETQRSEVDMLGPDEDFVATLAVNSLQFISLITKIEAAFGIEIPDEELLFERLNTINKLNRCVEVLKMS